MPITPRYADLANETTVSSAEITESSRFQGVANSSPPITQPDARPESPPAAATGVTRQHALDETSPDSDPQLLSAGGELVLETHLPIDGSPIIASRPSADTEEVELRLDLSDEEDTLPPPPAPDVSRLSAISPHSDDSYFENQMERSLDNGKPHYVRSMSKSPDLPADINSSHMYVRSAGFRGKPISPRLQYGSPVASPTNSFDNGRTDSASLSSHGSLKRSYGNAANRNTSQSSYESTNGYFTPEDRPAYNPGYVASIRPNRRHLRTPSPRPFPVPTVHSPSNSSHRMTGGVRQLLTPSPPNPQANFYTFSGDTRRPVNPYRQTSTSSPHRLSHETVVFNSAPNSPASQSSSTLPPRFVSASNRNTPNPPAGRRFYVVTDAPNGSRQAVNRSPYRYQFEEDDTAYTPVYL